MHSSLQDIVSLCSPCQYPCAKKVCVCVCVCVCERERERQRDTENIGQRDRERKKKEERGVGNVQIKDWIQA